MGMGFNMRPGLTPGALLIGACEQCHNSVLDQALTRAKFNVDLTKMSREEKKVAIERIELLPGNPKRMPPERFRELNASEIDMLKTLLTQ